MIIKNITKEVLYYALREVNRHFQYNLTFRKLDFKGRTRDGGEKWMVGLGMSPSQDRRSVHKGIHGDGSECSKKAYKAYCERTWSRCIHRVNHCGESSKQSYNGSNRFTGSVCWHAHGVFFDALPNTAIIMARNKSYKGRQEWRNDYDRDWNAGSQMWPVMASESCACHDRYRVPSEYEVRQWGSEVQQVVDKLTEDGDVNVNENGELVIW